VVGGIAGDRLRRNLVAAAATLGHCIGMIVLAFSSSTLHVGLFALFHGLAWGMRAPLMGALRADYFGVKSYPLTTGVSSLVVMLGSVAGPLAVGTSVDLLESFELGFLFLAIVALLSSLAFLAASPPMIRSYRPTAVLESGSTD
jgi:sugar phosphate permease